MQAALHLKEAEVIGSPNMETTPSVRRGKAAGMVPKLWTRDYILVCLGILSQFMMHFMLIATLSLFVLNVLDGDDSQIGLMTGAYFASSIICRPIMGWLVDRYDKRIILIASFALLFAPCLGYFLVSDIQTLTILRLVHGVGFGAATTAANAVLADVIPPSRRGEGIGYAAMFMTLATVLGPMCGLGVVQLYGYQLLFVFSAAAAMLGLAACCAARLHQSHAEGLGQAALDNARAAVGEPLNRTDRFALCDVIELSAVRVGIVAALTSFAYSAVSTFISVYAFQQGQVMAAGYFFIIYAVVALATRPTMGRLLDRRGADAAIYPSMATFATGLAVIGLFGDSAGLMIGAVLLGFGNANLFSCLQTLAISAVPAQRSGAAVATYFILFDCGASFGAAVMGVAAGSFGYAGMYLMGAGVAVLACFLYAIFRRC